VTEPDTCDVKLLFTVISFPETAVIYVFSGIPVPITTYPTNGVTDTHLFVNIPDRVTVFDPDAPPYAYDPVNESYGVTPDQLVYF
jgi:hypothetical protein